MNEINAIINDAMKEQLEQLRKEHLTQPREGEFTVQDYRARMGLPTYRQADCELMKLVENGALVVRRVGKYKYFSFPQEEPLNGVI